MTERTERTEPSEGMPNKHGMSEGHEGMPKEGTA
jgi:hypothetical protein